MHILAVQHHNKTPKFDITPTKGLELEFKAGSPVNFSNGMLNLVPIIRTLINSNEAKEYVIKMAVLNLFFFSIELNFVSIVFMFIKQFNNCK